MEIHNVSLKEKPLFTDGAYSVWVGYIISKGENKDIPHYLILNHINEVVEGSSANFVEARGHCSYLNSQLEAQDELIRKGESLFEREKEKKEDGRSWN